MSLPSAAVVFTSCFEPPDLVTATLRGVVSARDHADVIAAIRAAMRSAGTVRVLIVLESFGGWARDATLLSTPSSLGDDDDVSRLAVVGRKEWRRCVLTLLARPGRRVPFRYFDTEAAARSWLRIVAREAEPAVWP